MKQIQITEIENGFIVAVNENRRPDQQPKAVYCESPLAIYNLLLEHYPNNIPNTDKIVH